MSFLIGCTIVMIVFAAFMTWISHNALRTGIIKGGRGKPIRREERPRLFAFCLAATSTYAAIFWIGTAVCFYTLISN